MGTRSAPNGFTPSRLLNYLHERLGTKSQNTLADRLGVHKSTLGNVNQGCFTSATIIAMLDAVPDLTLAELRRLAGMPREIK